MARAELVELVELRVQLSQLLVVLLDEAGIIEFELILVGGVEWLNLLQDKGFPHLKGPKLAPQVRQQPIDPRLL